MQVNHSNEKVGRYRRPSVEDTDRLMSLMERYNGLRWLEVEDCLDQPEWAPTAKELYAQEALMACYNG